MRPKKILIPFSILPPPMLYKLSGLFRGAAERVGPFFPFLDLQLLQSQFDISKREYLSLCLASTVSFFLVGSFFLFLLMTKFGRAYLAPLIVLFFALFIFFIQIMYPRTSAFRRIKDIDRNLLAALRTILVQVNAGVPLFNVLVGISKEDYGEISKEFQKVVKEISTGTPEVNALEEVSTKNPSEYFRRSIWQMVNGIKAGSSIDMVLKEVISALSQEQIIQIENYGSTLNPLAMFYMLVAVILPALSMTLMIVIASFLALSKEGIMFMFFGLYGFVTFAQIMFMGLIKSKRPNLLGV